MPIDFITAPFLFTNICPIRLIIYIKSMYNIALQIYIIII